MNNLINLAGAVLFGLLGATALIGALVFDAGHQFAVAALCVLIASMLYSNYREERKNDKTHEEHE